MIDGAALLLSSLYGPGRSDRIAEPIAEPIQSASQSEEPLPATENKEEKKKSRNRKKNKNKKVKSQIVQPEWIRDATVLKEEGNEHFKAKEWKIAEDKFEEALEKLRGGQSGIVKSEGIKDQITSTYTFQVKLNWSVPCGRTYPLFTRIKTAWKKRLMQHATPSMQTSPMRRVCFHR